MRKLLAFIEPLAALVTVVLMASTAVAASAKAMTLTLADGSKVAVTVQAGSPDNVFVLVNGLIYSTDRWNKVADGLAASGATVIRYALPGQPENLRLLKTGEEPSFFATGLTLDDMVQQLALLLQATHVRSKIHLVGLSYGASVAAEFSKAHAQLVSDTTFVSPLIQPVDNYSAQGRSLRQWLEGIRFWEESPCTIYGAINPFLCTAQDYWYDSLYESIYQTYLSDRISKDEVPKDVDADIFKKSVFNLVRAVSDFDLKTEIGHLHRVSMLLAEKDEAALSADQHAAWDLVPVSERGSFAVFAGAHHALPDEAPAHLVTELLKIAR